MLEIILIVAALSAFAVVHSFLITHSAKAYAEDLFGTAAVKGLYRLFFTIISLITTGAVFVFILSLPDHVVISLQPEIRFPLRLLQIGALIIGVLAFRVTPLFDFLGFTQAWRFLRGHDIDGDIEGLRQMPIIRTGVYGIVRHPLYLAAILLLACSPEYTRNWITARAICILYVLIGTSLEERRLLRERGEEYRLYQAEVPRLFPRFRRANPLERE